jgi:hypothetical protein
MKPPEADEAFDRVVRAIATLEVSIERVAKNQESLKLELKTIVPRLDTLTAEVRAAGARVHDMGNIVVRLINESAELFQAKIAFEKALGDFETLTKARTVELHRGQELIERVLSVLEARVSLLRDEVADMAVEERSGLMTKPTEGKE